MADLLFILFGFCCSAYVKLASALLVWSNTNQSNSGQSNKHFTLVIYESRVVIWGIFKSGTTLES